MRILVVEDEESLADLVKTRLTKEKFLVDVSLDGEEGLYNALSDIYDLVILDVMLPNVNGFEILKQIRENNINTKVIMLTAKGELNDKLEGLLNGADDYMTKPFHLEELVARVNIQLRKGNDNIVKDILEYKDLILNLKTSTIESKKTGENIEIGKKEFQLLEYLIENANIIVSKEQIYDKVWGIERETESNNLEAYLSFIRKKFKVIGTNITIKAIRGMGYKLEEKE